jgi:hypothetical protein
VSLVVCRQSSYTSPNLQIFVNGQAHQHYNGQDNIRRQDICGGHGMSGLLEAAFSYGGVIQNIRIQLQGIHFDMYTAKEIIRSATYDNPFN